MPRKYVVISVLCLLAAAIGYFWYAANFQGRPVLVASGHPQYPPFMWQDGDKIIGVGPELLTIAGKRLGIKVEARPLGTWDKVVDAAAAGKIDGLVALYMTDERKKVLNYSIPFSKDPVAIFVNKRRAFALKGWPDLIGKRGESTVGDSYGQAFDTFIEEKLNVERFTNVETNFSELLKGKKDYFIFALYPGLFEAKKAGVENNVTYLKPYATTENWYLAISKRSKFARYVPQINRILDELVKDGTVDRLITKYMEYYEEHVLDRVQQLVDIGVKYCEKYGPQETFEQIDKINGSFTRGDLYLFAFDLNGKCLAHGATPSLIGKNLMGLKDVDGKLFVKEFVEVARDKGAGWISYKWPYKPTGEIEPKLSYVKMVDGQNIFIGCGFYITK